MNEIDRQVKKLNILQNILLYTLDIYYLFLNLIENTHIFIDCITITKINPSDIDANSD